MPQYPGGIEALNHYIRKNLKRPKGKRLSGQVLVSFTVLQNGSITGVHVKPGNGLDPRHDVAAVELISNLKGFEGGKLDGQPDDIEIAHPVVFR
ncbi:energy transducer TonB [Hymenobacter koreensis]